MPYRQIYDTALARWQAKESRCGVDNSKRAFRLSTAETTAMKTLRAVFYGNGTNDDLRDALSLFMRTASWNNDRFSFVHYLIEAMIIDPNGTTATQEEERRNLFGGSTNILPIDFSVLKILRDIVEDARYTRLYVPIAREIAQIPRLFISLVSAAPSIQNSVHVGILKYYFQQCALAIKDHNERISALQSAENIAILNQAIYDCVSNYEYGVCRVGTNPNSPFRDDDGSILIQLLEQIRNIVRPNSNEAKQFRQQLFNNNSFCLNLAETMLQLTRLPASDPLDGFLFYEESLKLLLDFIKEYLPSEFILPALCYPVYTPISSAVSTAMEENFNSAVAVPAASMIAHAISPDEERYASSRLVDVISNILTSAHVRYADYAFKAILVFIEEYPQAISAFCQHGLSRVLYLIANIQLGQRSGFERNQFFKILSEWLTRSLEFKRLSLNMNICFSVGDTVRSLPESMRDITSETLKTIYNGNTQFLMRIDEFMSWVHFVQSALYYPREHDRHLTFLACKLIMADKPLPENLQKLGVDIKKIEAKLQQRGINNETYRVFQEIFYDANKLSKLKGSLSSTNGWSPAMHGVSPGMNNGAQIPISSQERLVGPVVSVLAGSEENEYHTIVCLQEKLLDHGFPREMATRILIHDNIGMNSHKKSDLCLIDTKLQYIYQNLENKLNTSNSCTIN